MNSNSQNNIITLESGGKLKSITFKDGDNLRLITSVTCGKETSAQQQLSGSVLEYKSGTITIQPKEQWYYYKDQVKYERKQITYSDNAAPLTFKVSDIASLDYKSKGRKFWKGLGATLISLGMITTLLVAPAISLKSNSGFNASRYYSTAGIGLIAIGVGIPLVSISEYKKYPLENYDNDQKKIWKVVEAE